MREVCELTEYFFVVVNLQMSAITNPDASAMPSTESGVQPSAYQVPHTTNYIPCLFFKLFLTTIFVLLESAVLGDGGDATMAAPDAVWHRRGRWSGGYHCWRSLLQQQRQARTRCCLPADGRRGGSMARGSNGTSAHNGARCRHAAATVSGPATNPGRGRDGWILQIPAQRDAVRESGRLPQCAGGAHG